MSKRFNYYPKSQMIVDSINDKRYFSHNAICNLLNELYIENLKLKEEIEKMGNGEK